MDKASHVAFFPFNMLYPIAICFAEMLLAALGAVLFFLLSPSLFSALPQFTLKLPNFSFYKSTYSFLF